MRVSASELETFEEIAEFIKAGDVHMDPALFWKRLGVDKEAIAHFAQFLHRVGKTPRYQKKEGSYELMILEFGARLALRAELEKGEPEVDG